MGFLDQLKEVWPLVIEAPWGFAALALAIVLAGWLAGRFMFNERIETLKERIEAYKEKLDGASPDEAQAKIAELEQRLNEATYDARLLTVEQIGQMTAVLQHRKAGEIFISRDNSSVDSARIYAQVRQLFKKHGWNVTGGAIWGIDAPPECGITVLTRTADEQSPLEDTLLETLNAGGIQYELRREKPREGSPALQLNFSEMG